jgi:hydrogenase maturation protease
MDTIANVSEPFDDPSKRPPVDTLIIGCGNLLRGDDAVGPVLIRHLWDLGLPDGVNCADGGTGGMDVAFQMRGVRHVILIDACVSDSEPGAIFKLPGEAVETLPPLKGINLHAFRWDHALSFAHWLLKDDYPQQISVYLIEAKSLIVGDPLSAPVAASMRKLARILLDELAQRTALIASVPERGVACVD